MSAASCLCWRLCKHRRSKVRGMKGKETGRKAGNGNPLIRTWKQQQLSWESEEQQNNVTDNYCVHGSIQYKHPCVLLRRWVTLKIRCHRFSCFLSSKRRSVKNKRRGKRLFFFFTVYSAAISPSGKIEVLMKHIRQTEAVRLLRWACVCMRVCRCGSVSGLKRRGVPFIPAKSDNLEGMWLFIETCVVK